VSAGARLVAFAVALVAVFGLAAGVGSLFETADTESGSAHGGEADHGETAGREEAMSEGHGSAHSEMNQTPAGLAVADREYRLQLETTQLRQGRDGELRFSITDEEGQPVDRFDELHERRMHLIVVRRDGAEFNHLHPEIDEAGTWTAEATLEKAGVYRAFADFSVEGEQHTLAGDVFVSGTDFEARSFPDPAPTDSSDGYEVSLHADAPLAGEPSSLIFAVTKEGREVENLDPYLGAKGHLVALREGDLAFLHVHPEDGDHGQESEAGHHDEVGENEIAFAATFPTAGRYRLYLQFKHEGRVRTAEFTVVVPR
jgi:hypothetical protein